MQNKLAGTCVLSMAIFLLTACGGKKPEVIPNPPTSSPSFHPGAPNYIGVDITKSVVEWSGNNESGNNKHNGYVSLSRGELKIDNGELKGGLIEIDMNTITDENHKSDNMLVDHLKDPDFFEVNKFPIANIEITGVEPTGSADKQVTGNLMIRGITNPVTFPARVEVRSDSVYADANLAINRSRWGMRYKSPGLLGILPGQGISDTIKLKVRLVARR